MMNWEIKIGTYAVLCVRQLVGSSVSNRELGSGLCDDLGGGWGRERSRRERKYVYTWLIHSAIQQKLKQQCKASIFP